MLLRRAFNLPWGTDFFRYANNRINYLIKKQKRSIRLPHPISLMIELTNHCQLKCMICAREHRYGQEMDKGHMKFEQFKKLIDENHVYLDRIGLTGLGETLLYPHIIEAVRYIRAKNKGISVFISTNAYQANAAQIVAQIADDIDTLQISLDGIGSVFEGIRLKSNYNKYYNNLKAIVKHGRGRRMTVKFNMVVFKQNYHQMSEVVNLASQLGVQEIYFNTFNLVANDFDLSLYDFYNEEIFRDEFKKSCNMADKLGIYVAYHELDEQKGFKYCAYPWDDFYISWDGFSVPCCAKPFPKEKNFGNVFQIGLHAAINNIEFQKFRQLANQNITPDFCHRCHKIY